MGKIIWTERAATHLKTIHDYIAEDSPIYARRFVRSLALATDKLQRFPRVGRSVPEFEHSLLGLREVIFKGYRIIYQITTDDDVEILTIIHGREDFMSSWNKDWTL